MLKVCVAPGRDQSVAQKIDIFKKSDGRGKARPAWVDVGLAAGAQPGILDFDQIGVGRLHSKFASGHFKVAAQNPLKQQLPESLSCRLFMVVLNPAQFCKTSLLSRGILVTFSKLVEPVTPFPMEPCQWSEDLAKGSGLDQSARLIGSILC